MCACSSASFTQAIRIYSNMSRLASAKCGSQAAGNVVRLYLRFAGMIPLRTSSVAPCEEIQTRNWVGSVASLRICGGGHARLYTLPS